MHGEQKEELPSYPSLHKQSRESSLFRAESEWGVHRVHGAEPVESLYVPAGQLRHWSSGALSLKWYPGSHRQRIVLFIGTQFSIL